MGMLQEQQILRSEVCLSMQELRLARYPVEEYSRRDLMNGIFYEINKADIQEFIGIYTVHESLNSPNKRFPEDKVLRADMHLFDPALYTVVKKEHLKRILDRLNLLEDTISEAKIECKEEDSLSTLRRYINKEVIKNAE